MPLMFIIFGPALIIVMQNETGGALVFLAFLLVLYREGMNGIVLLVGSFAVLLFVVIIKLSIVPIQVDHGTLGMLLGMGLILLVQVIYAVFIGKNNKEALILLAGTLVIGVIAYVLNIWFYLNYNYVA